MNIDANTAVQMAINTTVRISPFASRVEISLLLYQLVEQHYPTFRFLMATTKRPLPDLVQQVLSGLLVATG
jgi:hypothetical protein